MKFLRTRKPSGSLPDLRQLYELIENWESKAAEAEQLAAAIQQSPLFAGSYYGMSDGLKLAASDLRKSIETSTNTEKS
jgi:hypothetical protein